MVLGEVDVPEPGPGAVRIRNRAAALNFFDVLQIQGKYQSKPPFPFTPGAEVAGVVDAFGAGVADIRTGDAVLAFTDGGGFAEHTVTRAGKAFAIPLGMNFEQAAAMPIVYHTSWFALSDRAGLKPGEWLLVHAGASGVGMSAIQLGRAIGARVIATAGSDEKLRFAARQGAEHTLNYSDEKWVDAVKDLTHGGADVIYDPVGGDVFDLSTKCIAAGGRLLVIGFAGGRIPSIAANRILLKNISVVGVFWGNHAATHPEYTSATQSVMVRLWSDKKICPEVSAKRSFEELPQAMHDLLDRRVMGKAVVTIPA
jgi:NADPH2:quinone reductase